jgi:hypothetical protein
MTGKEFIESKLTLPNAYISDDKLYTKDKVYLLGDLFDEYAELRLSDVIKSVCDHKQVDLVRHACKCKKCGKVMETEW